MIHYTEKPTPNQAWEWLRTNDSFVVYPGVVITHKCGFYWVNDTVRFVSVVKAIDAALAIADAPYQAAMKAKSHSTIPQAVAKALGKGLGWGVKTGAKVAAGAALVTAKYATVVAQATWDGLKKK
jgi:hypothetical protein